MTESDYIDVSNLARLRFLQSAMTWLLPTNDDERHDVSQILSAIARWEKALTMRLDGKVV